MQFSRPIPNFAIWMERITQGGAPTLLPTSPGPRFFHVKKYGDLSAAEVGYSVQGLTTGNGYDTLEASRRYRNFAYSISRTHEESSVADYHPPPPDEDGAYTDTDNSNEGGETERTEALTIDGYEEPPVANGQLGDPKLRLSYTYNSSVSRQRVQAEESSAPSTRTTTESGNTTQTGYIDSDNVNHPGPLGGSGTYTMVYTNSSGTVTDSYSTGPQDAGLNIQRSVGPKGSPTGMTDGHASSSQTTDRVTTTSTIGHTTYTNSTGPTTVEWSITATDPIDRAYLSEKLFEALEAMDWPDPEEHIHSGGNGGGNLVTWYVSGDTEEVSAVNYASLSMMRLAVYLPLSTDLKSSHYKVRFRMLFEPLAIPGMEGEKQLSEWHEREWEGDPRQWDGEDEDSHEIREQKRIGSWIEVIPDAAKPGTYRIVSLQVIGARFRYGQKWQAIGEQWEIQGGEVVRID